LAAAAAEAAALASGTEHSKGFLCLLCTTHHHASTLLLQRVPQVAYGNILAEDPAGLAPRHMRQLVLLGQACLDYLWAICMDTSRIIVSNRLLDTKVELVVQHMRCCCDVVV
jgi:hypothetical protein